MTPECEKAWSAPWSGDGNASYSDPFSFENGWNAALKWRDAQTGSAGPVRPCDHLHDALGWCVKCGCRPILTADDVRRIVREELQAQSAAGHLTARESLP